MPSFQRKLTKKKRSGRTSCSRRKELSFALTFFPAIGAPLEGRQSYCFPQFNEAGLVFENNFNPVAPQHYGRGSNSELGSSPIVIEIIRPTSVASISLSESQPVTSLSVVPTKVVRAPHFEPCKLCLRRRVVLYIFCPRDRFEGWLFKPELSVTLPRPKKRSRSKSPKNGFAGVNFCLRFLRAPTPTATATATATPTLTRTWRTGMTVPSFRGQSSCLCYPPLRVLSFEDGIFFFPVSTKSEPFGRRFFSCIASTGVVYTPFVMHKEKTRIYSKKIKKKYTFPPH